MSSPVKHTCPAIDLVINKIKSARAIAKDGRRTHHESAHLFSEIFDDLYGLENIMEELRAANSSLREWGHALEKDLEQLENDQTHTS